MGDNTKPVRGEKDQKLLTMACLRSLEVLLVSLVVCYVATVSSMDINLEQLLRGRQRQTATAHKRMTDSGNPCPEPEKPFPCKSTSTCIPMVYVCDDNYDCEDGYDEDVEVCTAAHRPPVEDIMHFLDSERNWIMPDLFAGKSVGKVAHALAISQTVGDFQKRVGMTTKQMRPLKEALEYIEAGHEEGMEMLGMPSTSWNDCVFFFEKFIKSGFSS